MILYPYTTFEKKVDKNLENQNLILRFLYKSSVIISDLEIRTLGFKVVK